MKPILIVALLVAASTGAAAQTLYKSTMPDGRIVYSEKPVPGAKRVDTVEPPPAQTGTTTITPQEKARVQQPANGAAPQQSTALDDARRQLKQAEAARESGQEPLPGERVGTAGGVSRLTEAYHARQKGLELAAQAARQRVQELERGR
jgi:cytoskeletal protein RodZ